MRTFSVGFSSRQRVGHAAASGGQASRLESSQRSFVVSATEEEGGNGYRIEHRRY